MSDLKHPSRTHSLPWQRRLEAKMLVSMSVISGCSLVVALLAADRIATGHAVEQSTRQLGGAQAVYHQIAGLIGDAAAAQCRLIAELPVFRANLDLGDPPTIARMTDDYRQKLGATFCIVTTGAGRWLGSPGWPARAQPPAALLTGIRQAQGGRAFRGYVALGPRLFLVVSEPMRFGEEVLGTLTAGYLRDDAAALELARMTGCAVSFVFDGHLCGSSLQGGRKAALEAVLAQPGGLLSQIGVRTGLRELAAQRYVVGTYPLTKNAGDQDPGRLLLLQAWQPTQLFLDEVKTALSVVVGLSFLLALAGGLVLTRRITQPLREIVVVAEEIAAGDWQRRARESGSAEVAAMAAAFNHMTASLRHWYQEAQTHAECLESTLHRLQQAHDATLEALSRALDARDNETEGHSLRVTHYALRLAEQMGLDSATRAAIHWGALLHDIGKIGVPDAILHKPGKLTPEEMKTMRRHCEQGLHIVRGIPYLELAADVIGCHHERFDGLGYPSGLAAEEIPLTARVFAVADSLDAITSDRPYRRAGSFPDALAEIRGQWTQFDPSVVEALAAIIDELQAWRSGGQQPLAGPNLIAERTPAADPLPRAALPIPTSPLQPAVLDKEVFATT